MKASQCNVGFIRAGHLNPARGKQQRAAWKTLAPHASAGVPHRRGIEVLCTAVVSLLVTAPTALAGVV